MDEPDASGWCVGALVITSHVEGDERSVPMQIEHLLTIDDVKHFTKDNTLYSCGGGAPADVV